MISMRSYCVDIGMHIARTRSPASCRYSVSASAIFLVKGPIMTRPPSKRLLRGTAHQTSFAPDPSHWLDDTRRVDEAVVDLLDKDAAVRCMAAGGRDKIVLAASPSHSANLSCGSG